MKRPLSVFAGPPFLMLLTLIMGCGGGNSPGVSAPQGTAVNSVTGTGRAVFTIKWPDRGRLVPLASNSIKIEVKNGAASLVVRVVPRPANGGSSATTIASLPIGNLTVIATAYPQADGTGTGQAAGSAPLVIRNGQTTPFSLTMASTIDHLELSAPRLSTAIGGSRTLGVAAKDASGAVVLLAPSKVQWVSTNTAVAKVDSSGKVMGISAGMADISATDSESGKSVSVTFTVAAGGPITFAAPIHTALSTGYVQVRTADFDGDGKVDLVIGAPPDGLLVAYGKGDGTFETPQMVLAWTGGAEPEATVDMNNDGRPDIECLVSSQIVVLMNQGGRSFAAPFAIPVSAQLGHLAAGDFTGDGVPDIAYVSYVPGSTASDIHIVKMLGGNTYTDIFAARYGSIILGFRSGDINGDGKLDLAVSSTTSTIGTSGVFVYWGGGSGNLTPGPSIHAGNPNADWPLIADLNGDGRQDLGIGMRNDGNIAISFNNGNNTFTTPALYRGSDGPSELHAADFDGDGALDIVTENVTTLAVLRNVNALFPTAIQVQVGSQNGDINVADYNGDGRPDLLTTVPDGFVVLLNTSP